MKWTPATNEATACHFSFQFSLFLHSLLIGKPGTPDVFLGIRESESTSHHILWHKPDENGSAILLYSVYTQRLVTPSMYRTASSFDWNNVLNTTNRQTRLNITHDEDFIVIVTAWNKFGESKLDRNKSKYIYGKNIVRQGRLNCSYVKICYICRLE